MAIYLLEMLEGKDVCEGKGDGGKFTLNSFLRSYLRNPGLIRIYACLKFFLWFLLDFSGFHSK